MIKPLPYVSAYISAEYNPNPEFYLFGFEILSTKSASTYAKFSLLLINPTVFIPGFRIYQGKILPPQAKIGKLYFPHCLLSANIRKSLYEILKAKVENSAGGISLKPYDDAVKSLAINESDLLKFAGKDLKPKPVEEI